MPDPYITATGIVGCENGHAYSRALLHAATHLLRSGNVNKQGSKMCENRNGLCLRACASLIRQSLEEGPVLCIKMLQGLCVSRPASARQANGKHLLAKHTIAISHKVRKQFQQKVECAPQLQQNLSLPWLESDHFFKRQQQMMGTRRAGAHHLRAPRMSLWKLQQHNICMCLHILKWSGVHIHNPAPHTPCNYLPAWEII